METATRESQDNCRLSITIQASSCMTNVRFHHLVQGVVRVDQVDLLFSMRV
jgi:hypothetical protein